MRPTSDDLTGAFGEFFVSVLLYRERIIYFRIRLPTGGVGSARGEGHPRVRGPPAGARTGT
ncbi:hypothetical protein ALMP_27470 [Streptomyces sp. A012304]|nr:hypothetical protein ALMP_27470 [Streptomyces sp. A012304]